MSSNLLQEIEAYQNKYYDNNKKNSIFKDVQKRQVASQVATNFNTEQLLNTMCFSVPNTNKVAIDYTVFKLFANPNNYELLTQFILRRFYISIQAYGGFECHLNLDGFSVSAAQRYKTMIEIFCKGALSSDTQYSDKINKFIIYNPTSMIQSIAQLFSKFINPNVREKVTIHDINTREHWDKISSSRENQTMNIVCHE